MRCRWLREEIARSCAAWSICANVDNDNHINDDNAGRVRNNHAKRDFEWTSVRFYFNIIAWLHCLIMRRETECLALYLTFIMKYN